MEKIESCPMVGGDGVHSYAENSYCQKEFLNGSKELINESIKEKLDFESLNLGSSNSFHIADLGCSSGPNTFTAVQNIIEAIELQNPNPNETLEFQVFFNDHTDNDFNTLFRSLLPSRRYFAAGVPGSFHGQLFPNCSIHFVHSSFALHWLSRVPKEVKDPKSGAWNKGEIQCTGFVKEVNEAYANQYKIDIHSFLNARAKEVVSGGLMAIILCVLPNGVAMSQTLAGIGYGAIGSCLFDLAKLGLISQEKVDSFNLPLYFAPIKELEDVINENGSFSIEKMSPLADLPINYTVPFVTAQIRAVMGDVVRQHFGSGIVDKVFESYPNKLNDAIKNSSRDGISHNINLFVLLKRKF